jgi:hypothetical protein
MRLNRKTATALLISLAALTLYLRPGFASLEGELSVDHFPLDQMTGPYGDTAVTSSGGPSFGRAYTIKITKPGGEAKTIYLANPRGQVFGNNTVPAGEILRGCEVGDTIRVRGLAYSKLGPSWPPSWKPEDYQVLIIRSVQQTD